MNKKNDIEFGDYVLLNISQSDSDDVAFINTNVGTIVKIYNSQYWVRYEKYINNILEKNIILIVYLSSIVFYSKNIDDVLCEIKASFYDI